MDLRLSQHRSKHIHETWNQVTIKRLFDSGADFTLLPGQTADVLYGYAPDGECVGLIVSKEHDGYRVIITGFSAPAEYWQNV
jgi:hypothetical protein